MQQVNVRQVQRLMFKAGACVIDVLPRDEFVRAHVPGAFNVPLDHAFESGVLSLVPNKDVPVIVYSFDSDSQSSPEAASRLVALGYNKVFDYSGGRADWYRAGLRLETGMPLAD
jgi:rhodanese-related sulfurtransferase